MSLSSDASPLDAHTLRRVETYARTVGTTPAQVIREAIEQYLTLHEETRARQMPDETAFDVLRRAGLIGCIAGAPGSPTDLSTDPIHLEGFGSE
jgi:hypothetical protein